MKSSDLIKICHLIQNNIPSEYSSLSGSKVQEVEKEQLGVRSKFLGGGKGWWMERGVAVKDA